MRHNALRRALSTAAMAVGIVALSATAAAAHYEVEPGDTLAEIAHDHDQVASWEDLYAANQDVLSDPNLILPGQMLRLSGSASASAATSTSATSSSSDASQDTANTSSNETSADTSTETSGSVPTSTWDALAECESNGNWSINTGNGYYGGLQFALSSWEAVGGSGYPHEASKQEQIHRAELLLERQGWGAWPACSSMLGLR